MKNSLVSVVSSARPNSPYSTSSVVAAGFPRGGWRGLRVVGDAEIVPRAGAERWRRVP